MDVVTDKTSFTPGQSFGPKRVQEKQKRSAVEQAMLFIFIGSIIVSIGFLGYRFYLYNRLTNIQEELLASEEKFGDAYYTRVRANDLEVRAAKFLLARKHSHSKVFSALEQAVTPGVFYESFESSVTESGDVNISLGGVTTKTADLLAESLAHNNSNILSGVSLQRTAVRTEQKTGKVLAFNLTGVIPADLVIWQGTEADDLAPVTASATLSSPDTGIVSTSTATTTPQ